MNEPKTINEVARMGGLALKKKYGKKYFKGLGKKGGRPKKLKQENKNV